MAALFAWFLIAAALTFTMAAFEKITRLIIWLYNKWYNKTHFKRRF